MIGRTVSRRLKAVHLTASSSRMASTTVSESASACTGQVSSLCRRGHATCSMQPADKVRDCQLRATISSPSPYSKGQQAVIQLAWMSVDLMMRCAVASATAGDILSWDTRLLRDTSRFSAAAWMTRGLLSQSATWMPAIAAT